MPGVLSDTCQLDPDEVDPRCIDNEQYFDHDLGMYVLCDIIVCDDELVGEGDGGGSPNAPNDECTIACDPGWGEPGGGGSSGINLPTNPANEDIFVVIDPNTGDSYDLTFLQNWLSWFTPELRGAMLSTLVFVNIAPPSALPNIAGHARILSTITIGGLLEPTFAGEITTALITGVMYTLYAHAAYNFFSAISVNSVKNHEKCLKKYLTCLEIYGNNPYDGVQCHICQSNYITNGFWPNNLCPL